MVIMKRFRIFMVLHGLLAAIVLFNGSCALHAAALTEKGIIESVGKDSTVTILFTSEPAEEKYFITDNGTVYGEAAILSSWKYRRGGYVFKAIARLSMYRKESLRYLRPGMKVSIHDERQKFERRYSDIEIGKERPFRPGLKQKTDGREMILIPEGKFILGSNHGDRDEYPEQVMYVKGFYMDKYEVSNRDYLKYVKSALAAAPASWKGRGYDDKTADLPVMVTYYEAVRYAKWAGKRLPTEFEWEKAARGVGRTVGEAENFPWGSDFDPSRSNSAEYWLKEKESEKPEGAVSRIRGLLPVTAFEKKGDSPYGIVNMSGNAPEWTSSWYSAYKGNKKPNRRYGMQYRVIRGGAWFNSERELRVTKRQPGGLPSLETDNRAGFRCVKDVSITDQEN